MCRICHVDIGSEDPLQMALHLAKHPVETVLDDAIASRIFRSAHGAGRRLAEMLLKPLGP